MKPLPVQEYLWNPAKYPAKPICVVYGDDVYMRSDAVRHIRNQVLAGEDAEFSLNQFEGDDSKLEFKDVLRELQTVAMFGGGRRFVRIDEADKFVTNFRAELENYAVKPVEQSVLILQLKTFASTTNLYKKTIASGLVIEAKMLSDSEMPKWVVQQSKSRHKMPCDLTAAKMMVERIGAESGLLDQELAKLVLMADAQKGITPELVEQAVGSWRSQTAFAVLDSALAGKTAAALGQLDALLLAGEDIDRIFGAFTSSLRKMGIATELILESERRGHKLPVKSALSKAGVSFNLDQAERQLIHLGRHRGAKLLDRLLRLGLAFRGESRTDQFRTLLEKFIVSLALPQLREKGR